MRCAQAVRDAEHVVVAYSGGRDSTLALLWTLGVLGRSRRRLHVVHVDTGAPLPDLVSHVLRSCRALSLRPEIVRDGLHILSHLASSRRWPHPRYRECMQRAVLQPIDRYVRSATSGDCAVVHGGRWTQRVSGGASLAACLRLERFGGRCVRLVRPYYAWSRARYERAAAGLGDLLWPGYAAGFSRTACWCCPFQSCEHWEAMRRHYPALHAELRRLMRTWSYLALPNDGYLRRLRAYWGRVRTC